MSDQGLASEGVRESAGIEGTADSTAAPLERPREGTMRITALLQSGRPSREDIAAVIARYPHEQDEIIRILHQTVGSALTNQALEAMAKPPSSTFGITGPTPHPTAGERAPHAPGPANQEFGSDEHQAYGNTGAQKAGYTGTYSQPANGYVFQLSQGDISSMCGDEFDPRVTDETKPKSSSKHFIADNFWKLASTASSDPGRAPGTQDEIVYALYKDIPADPRFQPKGMWASLVPVFNEKNNKVKQVVDARYLQLASGNFEHFAHPGGKTGPKEGEDRGSAGGSYRALHEDAIHRAYDAKTKGQPINEAMAHDAAAQHFLQDSFSSGHVRTPRREISEYWDAKYPLLNDQFKKSIAQEMAIYINANETNIPTVVANVRDIYHDVIGEVDKMAGAYPPLTMDPLVGLVAHDADNANGLFVRNEIGDSWKDYGDGKGGVRVPTGANAPPQDQNATRAHVEQAAMLSVQDIQTAHAAPANLQGEALMSHVRSATPTPAKPNLPKYGAEQAMPQLDMSKNNGVQQWRQPSLAELWAKDIRTDVKGVTFGSVIENSFQDAKGDFHKTLAQLAGAIDAKKPVKVKGKQVGMLHPQAAFINGFMAPLIDKPLTRLQKIIEFNPAAGQNYVRDDGATMEDLDRLDHLGANKASEQSGQPEAPSTSNSGMHGLSLEQRAQYVKNLTGGYQAADEIRRIYELFITTPTGADRREVYKLVEGRTWTGTLTQKDSLWVVFQDEKWRSPFIAIMNLHP